MMRRVSPPWRQRGVALITALLITALVTVAAVAMAARQQLDIRRSGNLMQADQAYQYALGVEEWAQQILLQDDAARDTLNPADDLWTASIPALFVEGGAVQGSVEDLQGRFNLNNLIKADGKADPQQVKILQTIFAQVDATEDELALSPFLVNAVVDWIDADLNTSADGAEDLEYLALTPPYRAANRPMASPSELRAVAGFSPRAVAALSPLLAALPTGGNGPSPINVNTAPEMVLMGLDSRITPQIAQALAAYRKDKPFEKADDFVHKLDADYQIKVDAKLVDVKSDYFAVTALAKIGRTAVQLHSLLRRTGNQKVAIIQRSIGVQ